MHYQHYADVPDMQIDVVYVPIVRSANIDNEWIKYDDTTKCIFDILNDNITTANVRTKTHDFVNAVRQYVPPKIQLPQFGDDTFAHKFCEMFMKNIIRGIQDVYSKK